jgi:hypothetical protein
MVSSHPVAWPMSAASGGTVARQRSGALPGNWLLPRLVAAATSLILVTLIVSVVQSDIDIDRGDHPCRHGNCIPPQDTYWLSACNGPCNPADSRQATSTGVLTLASTPVPEARWQGSFTGSLDRAPVRWRYLAEGRLSVTFQWDKFSGRSFVFKRDGNALRGYESIWGCTGSWTGRQVFAEPIASKDPKAAPEKPRTAFPMH